MSLDLVKEGRVSFVAVMQGVTRRSTSYSKVPVWLPFPFDVTAERGVCAQLPESAIHHRSTFRASSCAEGSAA